MRLFHCDRCGSVVAFSARRCPACDAELGYVDGERTIRVLTPTEDAATFRVDELGSPVWRCLNAAWGCNWVVPAVSDNAWCRSCQLTRGRPDEARPDSIDAWMSAEAAKRRLVHQLDEIGLPIVIRSGSEPDGLAFDLVHIPGAGGITGHADGIVTLDLAEADDRHREDLRRRLDEPFRTMIGHLRHEIGHHYWRRLVGRTDELARFRALFGDERVDYAGAIESHYAGRNEAFDAARFVTAYAASHPLEDWAETFAHYLHIVDALDTAIAHGLVSPQFDTPTTARSICRLEFDDLLAIWRPVNAAVNAIAETLGAPAVYPFDPVNGVVDKLAFVHRQIGSHVGTSGHHAVR